MRFIKRFILVTVIVLLLIIPFTQVANALTYEDFTTYTEVDGGSDLTVGTNYITWSGESTSAVNYVYKDFGTDYFDASFEILFTVQITQDTSANYGAIWSMSDELGTVKQLYVDGVNDYLGLLTSHPASPNQIRWYLVEQADGSQYETSSSDYFVASTSTLYYCRILRDETIGDYGRLTFEVYSDSSRETLLDTVILDLHKKANFDVNYAHETYGSSTGTWGGQLTNMYISTLSGIGYVPTVLTYGDVDITDATGAPLYGWASSTGNITDYGFEWGTSSGTYTDNVTFDSGSGGEELTFTTTIAAASLVDNEAYFFRAIAKNAQGWGYGNEQSFIWGNIFVDISDADVTPDWASDNFSALFATYIVPNTADNITARMSTTSDFSTGNVTLYPTSGYVGRGLPNKPADYSYWFSTYEPNSGNLGALTENTTYYYQGIAEWDSILYYSQIKSFTTAASAAPDKPSIAITSLRDVSSDYDSHYVVEATATITTSNTTDSVVHHGFQFSLYSNGLQLQPTVHQYNSNKLDSDGTYKMVFSFADANWYHGEKLYFQAYIYTAHYGDILSSIVSFTPDAYGGDSGGVDTSQGGAGGGGANDFIETIKDWIGIHGDMGSWAVMGILVLLISLMFGVAIVMPGNTTAMKSAVAVAWIVCTVAIVGAFIFTGQLGIWPIVIIVGAVVLFAMIIFGTKLSGGGGNING